MKKSVSTKPKSKSKKAKPTFEVLAPSGQKPIPSLNAKGMLFEIFPTGAVARRAFTFEEWHLAYLQLELYDAGLSWAIGDLLNIGEGKFAENYAQVIPDEKKDPLKVATRANQAFIASKVPFALRHPGIPWRVYQTVAKLEPEKMAPILKRVLAGELNSEGVRNEINKPQPKRIDPVPSRALEMASQLPTQFGDLIREMPLAKWHPEAMKTVRDAFEGSVRDVRKLFGWDKEEVPGGES